MQVGNDQATHRKSVREIENVWEFQNVIKQEADQHGRCLSSIVGLDRLVEF
jgi:hypothetical protein